jgi:hypothetical protein
MGVVYKPRKSILIAVICVEGVEGDDCSVNAALDTGLFEYPLAVAIARTEAEADSVNGAVYCFVVPFPGVGVLPSMV